MKSFLYVSVGAISMLLPIEAVQEIISLNEKQMQQHCASDHFNWRQQMLPIICSSDWLNFPARVTPRDFVGVVYCPAVGKTPILLVVDRAEGQLKLGDSDFAALPPVPQQVFSYFNRVYIDQAESKLVYCLRRDLEIDDFNPGGGGK